MGKRKMPCKGCGSSVPGKTRCVVCDTKWCNSCLWNNAESRSSGWKCNGCVGTSSYSNSKNRPVLTKDPYDPYDPYDTNYDKYMMMRKAGYDVNDSNKNDYIWRMMLNYS